MTRDADELAQARRWFHRLAEDGPAIMPVTTATRKSLERLLKAFDDLDPYARALLHHDLPGMRATVEHWLLGVKAKVRRGPREYDYRYVRGVEYLVQAFEAKERCSPLTQWKKFQDFAGDITKHYAGVPCPGDGVVRRCLAEDADDRWV